MSQIVPTSKMSLKMSCLAACNNDIDKADRLYTYLVADLGGLPDFDPVRPSGLQQVKQSADEVLGWISSHQDEFARGIDMIRSFRKPAPAPNVTSIDNVEPIPSP